VNCTDNSGYTPLFWASRSSLMSNIIELVDHGADVNFVAKYDCFELDGCVFRTTPLFHARTNDTIKLLLSFGADPAHKASKNIIKMEQANNIPNIVQPKGVTRTTSAMFHFYEGNIKEENDVTINLDNINGIDENSLPNGQDNRDSSVAHSLDKHMESQISAVEHLMQFHLDCSKAILDASLTKQDHDLVMDLHVFEDQHNEMSLFMAAEKNHMKELFLHPLLQIFLSLKWDTVKPLFWIKLFFQLCLVIIMTYIGVKYVDTTHCNNLNSTNPIDTCFESTYLLKSGFKQCNIICNNKSDVRNDRECPKLEEKIRCFKHRLEFKNMNDEDDLSMTQLAVIYKTLGLSIDNNWRYDPANWLAIILMLFVLGKELCELTMNGLRGLKIYLQNLHNWIQCFLISTSVVFSIYSECDFGLATHAAAWMVFLVWIDLTLYIGKLDIIGEYIYMSVIVSKTIFCVLFIYVPSYLAFTFGFYILLKSNPAFDSYTATFIRILAMKAGELDYKDDFSYYEIEKNGGANYSVQMMFVFFLICISLIVMNLLLAVTVNKTENLATKSKKMRAGKKIKNLVETIDNKHLANWCFCFPNLKQPVLPNCEKDNNYFVSIKSFNGCQKSFNNRIRRFFHLDQLRELYIFEDGKQHLKGTGMQIPDTLFKEAMKFVRNKQLNDIEFWKNISSLREQTKLQLNSVFDQTHSKVAKKNDLELQTLNHKLSEIKSVVSDMRSEQNKAIEYMRSEQNQAIEALLEKLKNILQ